MTTSYKQSLRQRNEAKCWVVNKRICLKDTIMEFELETELNLQRLRYKKININHFLSQNVFKRHRHEWQHNTEKGSVILLVLSVGLFTIKYFNILSLHSPLQLKDNSGQKSPLSFSRDLHVNRDEVGLCQLFLV